MKPVFQTKFGDKEGNCFEACIASIFELSLDDLPPFNCAVKNESEFHKPWHVLLNDWLRDKYGLYYMELTTDWNWTRNIGYHIITGESPRLKDMHHAVVGLNGKMVHDPIGPEGPGVIKGTEVLGLFFKMM